MQRLLAGFATALMLGGSTMALAQQGKEGGPPGGGAGTEQRGQTQQGGVEQGRGPAADRGRGEAPRQDKGPERAREAQRESQPDRGQQRAQERQPDRPREAQDKQPERSRQAEEKQQRDRANQRAQDKQADRARQAEEKQKQQQDRTNQRAQDRQADRARQAEEKQKQQQDRANQRAQDRQAPERNREALDKQQRPGSAATGASERDGRDESVQLSNEQRQRVRDEFRRSRSNVRHYTNVRVNISLGQRLPRTWTFYEVPRYVVDVAPRYRGYRYAWVDNRYCIVDPATYEIVAYVDDSSGVIYASDGGGSAATGRGSGEVSTVGRCEVNFNEAERRRIVAEVEDRRPMSIPGVRVGIDIPGDIELKIFPTRLRGEFERLDGCRYVPISDDSIAIVEPSTRRIVAIVER